MKKLFLFLLLILALTTFVGCDFINNLLGQKRGGSLDTGALTSPSYGEIEEIQEAVEEKGTFIDVTIIPEEEPDVTEVTTPEETEMIEEEPVVVGQDYFEMYIDDIKVRTFYRLTKHKFSIGRIKVKRGSKIYWKYYKDGVLEKVSDVVVLDSKSRKELIVLYLEMMYIYKDGKFGYEKNR